MKIKSSKTNTRTILWAALLFMVLLLGSFKIGGHSNKKDKEKASIENIEPDAKTEYNRDNALIKVVKKGIGILKEDEYCTIHLYKELGTPVLVYDYTDSLTFEEETDRFFLQVYLKNDSIWRKSNASKFVPMDFNAKPFITKINGRTHYIFSKVLTNEFVELSNIKKINTGRFKAGLGKSYAAYSLNISKIEEVVQEAAALKNFTISIKKKAHNKLKKKRKEAFHNRILMTEDEDLVNAKVSYDDAEFFDAKARLKGDWTDHLNDSRKWSYRVIMEDGYTIKGLRKFSIQHPKVRTYLWEWLFNKAVKQNDLIGITYDFVNVEIRVQDKEQEEIIPLGIMALEEAFDKILIESNRRREGIIMAFDESFIWADRNQQRDLDLSKDKRNRNLQDFKNVPIKLYNESKVLSDPKLKKQFDMAFNLLKGLQEKKLKVSDAFDVDKLTMFVALANLFGGFHSFVGHNLKIYYNPVTNKLEPISWDSNSGKKIERIYDYRFSSEDDLYIEKLIEKLTLVSSTDFLNTLISTYKSELNELSNLLNKEFENANLDISILEHNSNVIKKELFPATAIISGLLEHNNNEMLVSVENVSEHAIVVNGLNHKDGKSLSQMSQRIHIEPGKIKNVLFPLKEGFINAFVSKKNKRGEFRFPKDLGKISVNFNMLGHSINRKGPIIPFGMNNNLDQHLDGYKASFSSDLSRQKFLKVNEKNKTIQFRSGSYELLETLVIPSGYDLTIEKGFSLDLKNGSSLISYSSVNAQGTAEMPIKFYSSDGTGAGIFVSGTSKKSLLNYCEFTNLSNPTTSIWELSGAVNFNESEVEIRNSVFRDNRCEDGLNIIRSKFELISSEFENTFSDAFDGDFVDGRIVNCRFTNLGNDGIDISGSKLYLEGIVCENPSDKGISAGEDSEIDGRDITIKGGEIGIVSKDLSRVTLSNVRIASTRLAFSSYQKKSEFGPAMIRIDDLQLENNEVDYLIEIHSQLMIDNVLVETVSDKVIDQMYGKEYGKSSK